MPNEQAPAATVAIREDQNARIRNVAYAGGESIINVTALPLLADEQFGAVVAPIDGALERMTNMLGQNAAHRTRAGLEDLVRSNLVAVFQEPFHRALASVTAAKQDEKDWRSDKTACSLSFEAASEARTALRGVKQQDALQLCISHPDIGAAALASWGLSGLPNSLRPAVEDAVIAANLRKMYAPQTPMRPTGDNLFPEAADRAELDNLVRRALAARDANRNRISQVESFLYETLDYCAALSGQTRNAVFSALQS